MSEPKSTELAPPSQFAEFGQNAGFVEDLFKLFLSDPQLVDSGWRAFFERNSGSATCSAQYLRASAQSVSVNYTEGPSNNTNGNANGAAKNGSARHAAANTLAALRVARLVAAYRERGHLAARSNPLSKGIVARPHAPELDPAFFGLKTEELSQTDVEIEGIGAHTASDVIALMKQAYCGPIGFEYAHLTAPSERAWWRERIENEFTNRTALAPELLKSIEQKLIEAEIFEAELHRKYVGAKRFSLQGGDALLPMLEIALRDAAAQGVREVVLGMAHRGRLSTLVNMFGKPFEKLFAEFDDNTVYAEVGCGDVKYHGGYSSTRKFSQGHSLELTLVPNPSHLEAVNPVVTGIARALQDTAYARDRRAVLPILIHGDAAVIGQGVVYEGYNLARVAAFDTGGSLHIVINNQIGFTTEVTDARSSVYCTDPAKAFEVPVLHVNGEDIEACCWAVSVAMQFRERFARDVLIDLYCHRKYGHNEGDDPSFTQPAMYAALKEKRPLYEVFGESLVARGIMQPSEIEEGVKNYRAVFEAARERQAQVVIGPACPTYGRFRIPVESTGVSAKRLRAIGELYTAYPKDFRPNPKLHQILEKRVETLRDGNAIDWGLAEGLAFGSLVQDGYSIRLTGQDVGRGTFSQRHLVLSHNERAEKHRVLAPLASAESQCEIFNSTLSEYAVVAYEFGYSSVAKKTLVLWEAQFGDFVNGAQIAVDQFLASSEVKWGQLSGLTLLLPHGYEGQGPEHSSARPERFLQLCADGNISVCNPTQAAQHFHLLRRQGLSEIRRPLIIMTPKSLLRNPGAASSIEEFDSGGFKPVLVNDYGATAKKKGGSPGVHVIFLSGKVFHDLSPVLSKGEFQQTKVLRLEELYPFPEEAISKALKGVTIASVHWVQEEPRNMAAWSFVEPYLRAMKLNPAYIGRPASASTATGSGKRHNVELQQFITELLNVIG